MESISGCSLSGSLPQFPLTFKASCNYIGLLGHCYRCLDHPPSSAPVLGCGLSLPGCWPQPLPFMLTLSVVGPIRAAQAGLHKHTHVLLPSGFWDLGFPNRVPSFLKIKLDAFLKERELRLPKTPSDYWGIKKVETEKTRQRQEAPRWPWSWEWVEEVVYLEILLIKFHQCLVMTQATFGWQVMSMDW